ncbi:MAG: polysaccharide deacetylase family protein [Methanomicrobiales archaeon]|nr:polysaccharide deacetylase family protein [Methanomicrobiales archaeon]
MNSKESEYTHYGRSHFFLKYGLSPENENFLSNINIIREKNPEEEIGFRGWLKGLRAPVPLFSTPQEQEGNGEEILIFSDSRHSFCCASRNESNITIGFDLFHEIGLLLSGKLEEHAILPEKIDYRHPYVDLLEKFFFESMKMVNFSMGLPLIHKAFWPRGKPFALCLTHDVDELKKTYQWFTIPLKKFLRMDIKGVINQLLSFFDVLHGKEPFWTFPEILAMEEKYHARSSFYFLQETAEVKLLEFNTWRHLGRRYSYDHPLAAQLLKSLQSGGWEVGLHGSYQSYADLEKLRMEKENLEKALGCEIHGIRQHNLNLRIPDTWFIHETLGLSYDTTLGFNDRIGFRWGTCFPFNPFIPEQKLSMQVLEIPLIIEDLPFFRTADPFTSFSRIVAEIEYVGGLLTVLWHPPVFNSLEYPGWKDAYDQILAYASAKDAWMTSAKEVADWWRERGKNSFKWEKSGDEVILHPSSLERGQCFICHIPPKFQLKNVYNSCILREDPDSSYVVLQTYPFQEGDCIKIYMDEMVL